MDKLREEHDAHLALKPETAVHDEATCPFCNEALNANDDSSEGGSMDKKTYSEDEFNTAVQAAVEEALTPVQEELANLKAAQDEAEVDAKVTEAKAEAQKVIDALQADLDNTKVELAAAKTDFENYKTEIADFQTAVEEAARKEEVKTARLAEVAEVTSLDEATINERIDAWVEKSEDDWNDIVAGWKAIASKSGSNDEGTGEITEIPETSMGQPRDKSTASTSSAFKDILKAGRVVDIRRI